MARLGDVCVQITDGSHNPPAAIEESKYLMISSKNIDDDCITLTDPRYLSKKDFETENKRTNISVNDLLVTIVGTIGRVAIVPDNLRNICAQRSVAVLKPKSDIVNSRFLMYYLQHMRPQLEREARGVAQKGIYLKQLSNLMVVLPPLDKQKKIVSVMDKVSDLIAKRRAQLEKLDLLVKAKFVEMFGEYEDDIYYTSIEAISEMVTVGIANSATHAYTDKGVVMFRNQNIKENYLDDSDIIFIMPKFADKYKTKVLKANDILVTRTGYPGVACLVPPQYEGSQSFTTLIVRLKREMAISPVYVSHYINSLYGKNFVNEMKVGVAQQNFGAKALEKMPIFIPPTEQQKRFEAFVQQNEVVKDSIKHSLKKLETLKKALMQEYFG